MAPGGFALGAFGLLSPCIFVHQNMWTFSEEPCDASYQTFVRLVGNNAEHILKHSLGIVCSKLHTDVCALSNACSPSLRLKVGASKVVLAAVV